MVVKGEHIGSYGIIIDDDSIVLIKKANGGYVGKLDLPGGGIEHEETPSQALKREIMEEAGLTVTSYSLFDVTSNNFTWQMTKDTKEDLHHIGVLYKVKTKGILKKNPDGIDSLGAERYKIDALNKRDLTPFAIYSLEKLGYKLKD